MASTQSPYQIFTRAIQEGKRRRIRDLHRMESRRKDESTPAALSNQIVIAIYLVIDRRRADRSCAANRGM